jgi:ribosomal protein L37E
VTPTPSLGTSTAGGRKICPNCGATGFAIKEVEDKTKIISYIPRPQYAKKNICTKCGFEF